MGGSCPRRNSCCGESPANAAARWRGFGYHYECRVDFRVRSSGETYTSVVTGWLTPEDVGTQYTVHTVRHGKLLWPWSTVFLGWLCTSVFAIAFLFLSVGSDVTCR